MKGLARRLFSEELSWLRVVAIGAGILSYLRAARLPNAWAATQATTTYQNGFIKRGLLGSILSWINMPAVDYERFAIASVVFMAALLVVFAFTVRKLGTLRSTWGVCSAAILLSSFAFSFLAHLIGYLDIPILLLGCLTFWPKKPAERIAAIVLCTVLGLLFHELYLLAVLPFSLFGYWYAVLRDETTRIKMRLAASLIPIGGAVGMLGYLAIPKAENTSMANFLASSALGNANYMPRLDFYPLLYRPLATNWQIVWSGFHEKGWPPDQIFGILTYGFTVAALLVIGLSQMKRQLSGKRLQLARWLLFVCSLAPVGLIFIAVDDYRWFALATFSTFFCVAAVLERPASEPLPWQLRTCLTVVMLNLITSGDLYDKAMPEGFPFRGLFRTPSVESPRTPPQSSIQPNPYRRNPTE
ncbi:MAG: hypothetical protein JSS72_03355 [Armatimonadetes bacterium]|nr:hypothetical protein [Armatimonadota bacterium]